MNYKFFKKVKDQVIFDGSYMEVYIPKFYFEEGIATVIGNKIETLGIFFFKVFNSKTSKTGNQYTLSLPIDMLISFAESYDDKLKLKGSTGEDNYTILQLEKGDVFMNTTNITQSVQSTDRFVKLLHSGKLPNTIPYEDVLKIYLNNLDINKVNLGVPNVVLELIIAELYRSKDGIEIPFRKKIGKAGKVGQLDYQTTNLKNLANINSTFTAISFENMNQSIISSVNKSRNDIQENISPVEKTIKY